MIKMMVMAVMQRRWPQFSCNDTAADADSRGDDNKVATILASSFSHNRTRVVLSVLFSACCPPSQTVMSVLC
jgi:hypothetical protein